jgi:flavin reductase (DIM6/NTAB) family NADH-FMN oxidoreductase RutF
MPKTVKVEVGSDVALRLVHPMHTVLATCVDEAGKANIITLAWVMPTSVNPPLVVVSIAPRRYSHKLIEETGEFVVNVPTMEIVEQTLFCGRNSGSSVNKFKEAPLTPAPAKKVKAPIIKECVAHLECELVQKVITGDHTLFVGKILAAYVNKGVFTDMYDMKKAKPVFHMGGNSFVTASTKVMTPKLKHLKK